MYSEMDLVQGRGQKLYFYNDSKALFSLLEYYCCVALQSCCLSYCQTASRSKLEVVDMFHSIVSCTVHTPHSIVSRIVHTPHGIDSRVLCPGFTYEGSNEAQKKDFEKSIETIAVAFSSK